MSKEVAYRVTMSGDHHHDLRLTRVFRYGFALLGAALVASCSARSAEEEVRPIPACEALLSAQRTCFEKAGTLAASQAEARMTTMRKSLYAEATKGDDARAALAARCAAEEARVRTSCR